MKIGYLLQTGVPDMHSQPLSGPALHVKHIFEELQGRGHQVRLLAHFGQRLWRSDDLRHYEPVTVRRMDRGPSRLGERAVRRIQHELRLPYAALFESTRFALACRQELAGYDLLYERMGWMGYAGGLAARWMQIPLILEVNGDHLTELEAFGLAPQGSQKWLSLRLMSRAARQATHTVATGEGWRHRFIERWGVNPATVSVIENGSEVVALLKREQLRAFQPLPTGDAPVTIAYVGGFEPWHGILIFLRAAAKAIAQGVRLRLVLIGAGSEQHKIEQLVDELDLRPIVCFTGALDARRMVTHLAGAEIGVSPYCGRVEYSGLKLLDYKAAGLATIASGANGQPALITHGQTGWIVPPCDADALSDAIVHLVRNPQERRRLGQAARQEAETMHSWSHTAQALENLFRQVTEQ